MKINWRVRVRNKLFWLSLIPAVLLLVQAVASLLGYTINLGEIGDRLVDVVNAVFGVLVVLGVVTDPTTAGVKDSSLAMTYLEPKDDGKS